MPGEPERCACCETALQVTWRPSWRAWLCPACGEIATVRELDGRLAAAMDGAVLCPISAPSACTWMSAPWKSC